jgi:hypothetical protein
MDNCDNCNNCNSCNSCNSCNNCNNCNSCNNCNNCKYDSYIKIKGFRALLKDLVENKEICIRFSDVLNKDDFSKVLLNIIKIIDEYSTKLFKNNLLYQSNYVMTNNNIIVNKIFRTSQFLFLKGTITLLIDDVNFIGKNVVDDTLNKFFHNGIVKETIFNNLITYEFDCGHIDDYIYQSLDSKAIYRNFSFVKEILCSTCEMLNNLYKFEESSKTKIKFTIPTFNQINKLNTLKLKKLGYHKTSIKTNKIRLNKNKL